MQTNSSIIENYGVLAELVYQNKYLDHSESNVIDPRLTSSYTVFGVSTDFNYDSGFQGMLLENNDPKDGESKYVIAFRGTEPNQGLGEAYKDLIVADILYMGTGRGPQQMKDAMDFVKKMIDIHGLNSTNTNFTGHSLGGALAGMASYVYGFETYTYNGFGIRNMLWDVNDTSDNYSLKELLADDLGIVNTLNPLTGIAEFETLGEYLEANNIEIKHEENRITNIIHIGHSRTDLVGGIATDIVSGQIGESHFVVNNTGAAGGLLNTHSMGNLNDSIAIYNNALALFPDEDYNSLTDIIMNVKPDPKKVERFLNSLGEVIGVAHSNDRIELSENISNSGITNLTLNSLVESSTSSLENQAGSLAGMYALLNLNPFTITGANYSHLNQDGELDSANYSDQYIEDRAKFLYYLSHPDATVSNFDPDIDFVDNRLGISRTVDNGMMSFQDDSQYLFGNLEGELLEGEDESDHFYGMDGNDTLLGHGGDDYLEGGTGQDTLYGGSGVDTLLAGNDFNRDRLEGGVGNDEYHVGIGDIINDADGGIIYSGENQLPGLTLSRIGQSGIYAGETSGFSAIYDSNSKMLQVFNLEGIAPLTFTIENFASGTFGITLTEDTPEDFDRTLTGTAVRDEMGMIAIGSDSQYWQLTYTSFPEGETTNTPFYQEYLSAEAPRMQITGGLSGDFLFGFVRHDEIFGGDGGDIIVGVMGFWNGKPVTMLGEMEGDFIDGGAGDDWLQGAGESDQVLGGVGNDLISGFNGDDILWGDGDNDVLAGGSHADTLSGGDGDDILLGDGFITGSLALSLDNLASLSFSLTGPAGGYYTGYTTANFNLHNDAPDGGNDVLLGGAGRDWLDGGAGDDLLDGGSESDSLFGREGDDFLSGGAGNDWLVGDNYDSTSIGDDVMVGGAGDDTYVVNSTGDIVIEEVDEGTDTIRSSVSLALPENVEHIVFTGGGDVNAAGNSSDNVLSGTDGANILNGNAGNDTLNGLAGNDILDGGDGLDWLAGGTGDDTFRVDNTGDVAVENAGEGTDTVQAAVDWSLAANLENLVLNGDADLNGTGNELDNIITGNSGANILDGGLGGDTMVGGAGDDTFVVDVATDVVAEDAGEGIDTVVAGFGYVLSEHLENLTLTGSSAINGTGNGVDNVLIGNSGANVLDGGAGDDTVDGGAGNDTINGGAGNDLLKGGAGADTMLGGFGDDTYVVDSSSDVVAENADEGIDTVRSEITYILGQGVENLTLSGSAAINGTGNELDNILVGNNAANVLNGGAGVDSMMGGAGNDTYVIDTPQDIVIENTDEGIDTVQSGIAFTLSANLENLTLTGTSNIDGTGNDPGKRSHRQ